MNWWPGWDSIAGTHWWSNAYFWASITALIMLGVFEVVSHRYSERETELSDIQRENTDRQYRKDIADLHDRASTAEQKAAELGREAAQIRERAANLENEAAILQQKNLELEMQIAPRRIPTAEVPNLVSRFRKYAGQTASVTSYALDLEGAVFAKQLVDGMTQAGISVQDRTLSVMPMGGFSVAVHIAGKDPSVTQDIAGVIAIFGSTLVKIDKAPAWPAHGEAPALSILVGPRPLEPVEGVIGENDEALWPLRPRSH